MYRFLLLVEPFFHFFYGGNFYTWNFSSIVNTGVRTGYGIWEDLAELRTAHKTALAADDYFSAGSVLGDMFTLVFENT